MAVNWLVAHGFGLVELRCPRDNGEMNRLENLDAIRCSDCGLTYEGNLLYYRRPDDPGLSAPYGPWPFNFAPVAA